MSAAKIKAVVRVVIYTRISEGNATGATPESDRQEWEIREELDRRYGPAGWTLVAHKYDAESAWGMTKVNGEMVMKPRPDFDATLALAEAREVDVVATWSSDRLCRTVETVTRIIRALGTDPLDGVQWLTVVDDRIDLSTASGRKRAHEQAADAEFESARKSERVRSANRHGQRQGWAPPTPCYGYVRESWGPKRGGTFHQIPDEVLAVRAMADAVLSDAGAPSLSEIADSLNERGLYRRGVAWTGGGVYKLLRSPSLAALIADAANPGQYLPGNWTPILSVQEWEDIGHVLADPARHHRRKRTDYWLRDNLVDIHGTGMVGGRLMGWDGPGQPRATDRRAYRSRVAPGGGGRTSIDADAVEAFLTDAVEAALPALAALEETADGPLVLTEAEQEAEALDAELRELGAMKGRGEITMAEWVEIRRTLKPRVDAAALAARSARVARRRPAAKLHDVVGRWDLPVEDGGLTVGQKRAYVRRVVGRVTVLPAKSVPGRFRATGDQIRARLVFADDSPLAGLLAGR